MKSAHLVCLSAAAMVLIGAVPPTPRAGGVRPANPFKLTITSIAPASITPGTTVEVEFKLELLAPIPCDGWTRRFTLEVDGKQVASIAAAKPQVGVPVEGGLHFTAPAAGQHTLKLDFEGAYYVLNPGIHPCVNPANNVVPNPPQPFAVVYDWRSLTVARGFPIPVHTIAPTP
jgi:hypothetical protein